MLVEAAHWDATSMFRTGKRHKITSEAGKRNERGVDPIICEAAADRVVELLSTHGGGTADPGVTVVGTPPAQPPITIAYDLPARVTGMTIDAATDGRQPRGGRLRARPGTTPRSPRPRRRGAPTSTDPFDLVEEVARIVGYDQVPSVLPREAAGRGLTREQRLRRRVGRTLAGAGCVEVVSFPFVGDAAFDALGLPADDVLRTTVRLANPLSSEEPAYTTTLLPGLLKAAGPQPRARRAGRRAVRDRHRGVPGRPRPGADLRRRPAPERRRAGQAARGAARSSRCTSPSSWPASASAPAGGAPAASAGWSDAIGARAPARHRARRRGRGRVRTRGRPGTRAAAPGSAVGGVELGHAGELHPQVCAGVRPAGPQRGRRDRPRRPDAARASTWRPGPDFSTYPVAKEDVALVVDDAVTAADVEAALREGAGELLESVRLFDVYTGEQVGAGPQVARLRAAVPRPRPHPHRGGDGAARDAAVALAAERTGAVQRS